MPVEVEHLNNPLPDGFSVKCFLHGDTLDVCCLRAMQSPDNVPQLVKVFAHAAASTRSPTLQKSCSIPAAIAGVQRSVLCRFTKL